MDGCRLSRTRRGQRTQRLRRLVCGVLLLGGTLGARPAFAQRWTDHAIVSVNVGAQVDTERLSERITLEKNVEPAPVTATLDDKTLPFFDVGATFRIAGSLGVNVALSYLSETDTADVSAEIPHPFFFNRLRPISGQAASVRHRELAFHANVAYVVASPSVNLVLAGGASFFDVEQDFVTDVEFNESFPFDTATFRSATLTRVSATETGYNVSADVTWKIGESWGVGGLVRFSRATVPFRAGGLDFGEIDVGGLQAGGGLRLIF